MADPAPAAPAPPGIVDLSPIGRGGSATVYKGWQAAFNRSVAVKVLDRGPSAPSLDRFEKELRALGSLSGHPHVVPVYDAGELDGRPYLVMPFLSGGSLEDRLEQGPLPAHDVVRLGIAIADALASAHRLGVLHRDIKPANILGTAYGEPQLADFGIARFVDTTMTQTELTATVGYAAPEVLAGQPASPASDIYSLGLTLYAALRGTPAFIARDGEPLIAFAIRAMEETPQDLTAGGVDPALADVVGRAMAKHPPDRYQSASEFRRALEAVDLASAGDDPPPLAPIAVAPPGPARTGGTPRRYRGLLVAGMAAVALLAVTVGLLVSGPGHHPTASPPSPTPTTNHSAARTATVPPTAVRSAAAATTTPPTTSAPTTSAPTTTQPTAVPTTAAAPATAVTGAATMSASSAIAQRVQDYYALIDQHQLSQSFTWLSPAFQQRIGFAYYQQFWNGIAQVDLLNVSPGADSADITLRYLETNGSTQTETAVLTFVNGSAGQLLIDTDRVT